MNYFLFTESVTFAVWTLPPPEAEIVRLKLPVGVLLPAVSFKVELPEPSTVAGVKVAEDPEGNPEMLNDTLEPNPFRAEIVARLLTLLPLATETDAGDMESEKSGALTTRVTVALWARLPLVPDTVTVYVPAGVEDEVVMVTLEDPDPVTEAGLILTFAPAGRPDTLTLVVPLKPLIAEIVAIPETLDPCAVD